MELSAATRPLVDIERGRHAFIGVDEVDAPLVGGTGEDPAVLGDKLSRGSVLESLMPSARKAKLWDMYLERYLQIRREAEDDFQSIFGRAFVQAYERETARIKGGAPMAGGERGS